MKAIALSTALSLIGLLLATPAAADAIGLTRDTPAAYRSECGSCHTAFPPALLDAGAWRHVMASLDKHYGDNASLDAATARQLTDFMVANAGRPEKVGAGGTGHRLTETAWFRREHREVPARVWQGPKAPRAANCSACHIRADQGSYRERDIRLPDGSAWKDD